MKTLVLAVIGPHGAGKTSFIQSVTGCDPVNLPQSPAVIEDGQFSYTPPDVSDVSLHRCNLASGQTPYILVDTPGLCARRDNAPDHETVSFIKARLDRANVQLDGVIYLQRIMEATSADFAIRNLEHFHETFKSDEFQHVVVATTFWDVAPEIGPMSDQFFLNELRRLDASMQMEHRTARLYNDFESSIVLLRKTQRVSTFHPLGTYESSLGKSAYSVGPWEDILSNGKCCMM
ncbi:uncharacterized protein ColSpa_02837 [Colletotrichum spaethianum]|uniref:G domain-containing protein n=1 Tax=Colletotrichum spaethianum TaxID=700344 RepID=A0AA37L5Z5_9PEZI|nr:uncharacterized protein ColSpa_02837 [Colletotrichum spaethianum]GKT42656.1 hypothetical protein ColSpa_02837 [Colletotrichum spaethianum]